MAESKIDLVRRKTAQDRAPSFVLHKTPGFSLKRLLSPTPHWSHGSRLSLLGHMLRTEWELGQLYDTYWHQRRTWGRTGRAALLGQYQTGCVAYRSPRRRKAWICLRGQGYRLLLCAGWPVPPAKTHPGSSVFARHHRH